MSKKLTVCLDSNIYVSAVGFGGKPLVIVEHGLKNEFLLVLSDHIVKEVRRNLVHKVGLRPSDADAFLASIAQVGTFFSPTGVVSVTDDPNDNQVVETALMGFADVLVTGDRELVNLGTVGQLKIETALLC